MRQETDVLVELVTNGATIQQAAKLCNMSRATAHRRLVAANCTDRKLHPRVTPAERAEILRLLDSNHSRAEVARRVGRSKGTVVNIDLARRDGLPIRRRRKPNRCPGCGALVTLVHCVTCQARHRRKR